MSLSKKRIPLKTGWVYSEINVKEFIKELKEQFPNAHPIHKEIDNLAGNRLIETKEEQ